MTRKILYTSILFLFCFIFGAGCIKHNPPSWDTFVFEFTETYFKMNPDRAVANGRHEYDGVLPDYSEKGIREQTNWYKKQREQIQEFEDAYLLPYQRIEKKNLLRVIDENVFWLETMRWPYKNANYYVAQLSPSIYTARNYAPLDQRMKSFVRYLVSLKTAVKQIQENYQTEVPLSTSHIEIAKTVFGGIASYIKNDAPKVFQSIHDDKMQHDMRTAGEDVVNEINDFMYWLNLQMPKATNKFAIGAKNFQRMLYVTDCLQTPLPELEKMGEDDLQRNLAALKKACKKFAPGKSVNDCIALYKSEKPQNGPIEKAREQLPALEAFIKDKKIVSMPKYASLNVKETQPYMNWNYTYAELPAPYDKKQEGILHITLPDTSWTAEERNDYIPNENTLLFTSIHEIWPGHFLQSLYLDKNRSLPAKVFSNQTTFEGWGHYAEEMMFDQGYGNKSPRVEIGMRLNALMRDVRFIAAIKMHTEGMSIDEAEQMFVKYAFLDIAGAKQQALRGAFDPQYYGYTLGKLMIRKLSEDWRAVRPTKRTLRSFNNRFLSYGLLPIQMIRDEMMK
jgi:uncharacterized protein (DUF885 family)